MYRAIGFFGLIICFLFCSQAAMAKPAKDKSEACRLGKKLAMKDWQAGQAKYYAFGLIGPNVETSAAMGKEYGIQIISLGCVVSEKEMCYNSTIDMLMKKKTGKTVQELKTYLANK